ncbi:MAG TPA: type VI secretion system tube protein Hcp [Buttiauxella sp.]
MPNPLQENDFDSFADNNFLLKHVLKVRPYLANAVCRGKRHQKAEIKYFAINDNDAGIERETYRASLESVVIMSVNEYHTDIPGSGSPNMIEAVALRYQAIERFGLDGIWGFLDGKRTA